MSDTVKLIIEIPKEMMKALEVGNLDSKYNPYDVCWLVRNGIPLDDVKTEIDKAQEPYKTSATYDEGVRFGLMLAYQIIDKYKAESEVKPNELNGIL